MRRFAMFSMVIFGLGLAHANSQESTWEVPEEAKARTNPVERTEEAVKAGETLYGKHCLMCHGDEGKGDGPATKFIKPAPPDVSTAEAKARMSDGEIFYKVTNGKTPMPPTHRKLNEAERWQVVHYLRTLQVN